jgi:hypothetical protein
MRAGRCARRRRRLRVGFRVDAPVPVGGDPELDDPRGPGDHDHENAKDCREEQRDAERHVAVGAEIADPCPLPVLQYEDQQQRHYQRNQHRRHPHPAGPRPLDHMLRARLSSCCRLLCVIRMSPHQFTSLHLTVITCVSGASSS